MVVYGGSGIYLKVYIGHRVSHVAAPVASLRALEVGSPGLAETELGAEGGAGLLQGSALAGDAFVAPGAFVWNERVVMVSHRVIEIKLALL